jgi:hypothetical protein
MAAASGRGYSASQEEVFTTSFARDGETGRSEEAKSWLRRRQKTLLLPISPSLAKRVVKFSFRRDAFALAILPAASFRVTVHLVRTSNDE